MLRDVKRSWEKRTHITYTPRVVMSTSENRVKQCALVICVIMLQIQHIPEKQKRIRPLIHMLEHCLRLLLSVCEPVCFVGFVCILESASRLMKSFSTM